MELCVSHICNTILMREWQSHRNICSIFGTKSFQWSAKALDRISRHAHVYTPCGYSHEHHCFWCWTVHHEQSVVKKQMIKPKIFSWSERPWNLFHSTSQCRIIVGESLFGCCIRVKHISYSSWICLCFWSLNALTRNYSHECRCLDCSPTYMVKPLPIKTLTIDYPL